MEQVAGQQLEPPRRPAWKDCDRPMAERVDALIAELTLAEKVGQLGSWWAGAAFAADEPDATQLVEDSAESTEATVVVAPMLGVLAAGSRSLEEACRDGLGQLTRVYGSASVTPEQGAAEAIRQHHTVLTASRLGIPALLHEECLTGFTTYGATVYPTALAWAATFDPALVEEMAAVIGRDMAALGVHQGLAPVLDVVRDYRWGRVEETMGEDPYLVSILGAAYVRGLQSAGVLATLKHFAGYSASRAARNHGPVSMGRRELLDVIFPPFEAALAAGAGSVMNSYADVDGVPAGADSWLLTDVLRDRWGFTGTVVSDYWSVPFLATMHRIAADTAEAGIRALEAGIDVELPDTIGYGQGLVDAVSGGDLPEALVDRAARRVLTQKVELGLLDADWTPEASVRGFGSVELDSPGNRALARRLAERSIVLLDAGSALPLSGTDRPALSRIAVVGPCAADPHTFLGCYSFPNHVLAQLGETDLGIEIPSAVEALRAEFPDAQVVYELGCEVIGEDRSGFAAAIEATAGADLCVALVGDRAGLFGRGTSGEGCDVEDLRLPGVQADLLDALLEVGTPVVVVVVSGRPYALGEVVDRAAGLVQAFMPGEEGGAAIAGVLSGRVTPSGKLPVQIPRHTGGQPTTYLQPALGGAESAGISEVDGTPLFPFGYGASYTTFEIDDLRINATEIPTDGEFDVAVRVRNTGVRAGDEVVQLYLHDAVAQVARPVRQLAAFVRVALGASDGVDVTFRVHADRTAYTARDFERIVEAGDIEVLVGNSSANLPCRGKVQLTGSTRVLGSNRRQTVPVEVMSAVEDRNA